MNTPSAVPNPNTVDSSCVYCHTRVPPQLLIEREQRMTKAEEQQLWELFVAIAEAWEIEDVGNLKSGWLEFIVSKTTTSPSYTTEYSNATSVMGELKYIYGESAFSMLLFKSGVGGGPPTTRLAHAKHFVVDEFIRVQVLLGGFKSFIPREDRPQANYNGYMAGSRYNRLARVRAYQRALKDTD